MKDQIFIKRILVLTTLIVSVFINAPQVEAARLFFETKDVEVGVEQQMEITLRLDSEGETINALEGTIQIPGFLNVVTIRDGNSIVPFWSERPITNNKQSIVFSGVIPGGWQGRHGMVFSFIAQTNRPGDDALTISDAQVLLHDGKGTEVVTQTELLALHADDAIIVEELVFGEDDQEPPELFTPFLTRDPDIFEGDYILIFATQDKGSGIDRYEVQETRKRLKNEKVGLPAQAGEWKIIESPYRIMDQTLESFIYIRVVDRAGNIRVVIVPPTESPTRRLSTMFVVTIILLVLVGVGIYTQRRKQNPRTSN